jgi:hypothetical protein
MTRTPDSKFQIPNSRWSLANAVTGFARQFDLEPASNRHAGASRHPDCMLVALLLDSGFRRNDESKAASELAGKAPVTPNP